VELDHVAVLEDVVDAHPSALELDSGPPGSPFIKSGAILDLFVNPARDG